jgi:signal transduction histidine kinase
MLASTVASRKYASVISERNRLAEGRAEELERFAASVAHDLKGPLSSIALRAATAKKNAVSSSRDAAVESFDRIESTAHRADVMIDDLLTFARAGGREDADACTDLDAEVVQAVAQVRPKADSLHATVDYESAGPVWVNCTRGALASVLSNLLQNAVKYLADGVGESPAVHVALERRSGIARVTVSDNGPGIPAGTEEAVFKPYVRVG